jgi:predicted nucleotidyltransferase
MISFFLINTEKLPIDTHDSVPDFYFPKEVLLSLPFHFS